MNWNRPAVCFGPKLGLGAMGIALTAVIAGCGSQKTPLQVEVTQLGPYTHAAKAPNCPMPVLDAMPLKTLSQIAIVEAWADVKDESADVLPALQRKACETGADALVIINSQHQDIKNLLYASTPESRVESSDKAVIRRPPASTSGRPNIRAVSARPAITASISTQSRLIMARRTISTLARPFLRR